MGLPSGIIITAANSNFFDLVKGTVMSIRQKKEGRDFPMGFFDLGCTEPEIRWLREKAITIKRPEWHFRFPGMNSVPEHLKGLFVRPFLQDYFPGYDIYFWIDADAWVQDWTAVDLFIRGARKRGLAIVPEIDRGSRLQYGELPRYYSWAYGYYNAAYGNKIAKVLCYYPMLNAGVFAMHRDSPHWGVWSRQLGDVLQRTVEMMDQFALNYAVYRCGLLNNTEMLPAWCNWTCHYGLPSWDKERNCFVEPYLPHTKIGILHFTSVKITDAQILTTSGDIIKINMHYTESNEIQ